MKAARPPISLREPLESDLRFIRASWFESYRKGGCAPDVGYDVFKAGHGKLIDILVPGPFITVAYATEVPDEICGWICADPVAGVVHYVYVKQAYRRLGIAKELCQLYGLGESIQQHTHETRAGQRFASKLGTRFNPYPLYHLKPSE